LVFYGAILALSSTPPVSSGSRIFLAPAPGRRSGGESPAGPAGSHPVEAHEWRGDIAAKEDWMRKVLLTVAVIALAMVLGLAAAGCKKGSGSSGGGGYLGRNSQATSSA
jgi:hypothetical protein